EPVRRAWTEAEGDDDGVGGENLLRAGDRLGAATPPGVWLTQSCFDDLDAFDPAVTDDRQRLAVEQELHALVPGILHLLARTRHVFRIPAIGAGNRFGALSDRGAVAVHGGVAATQHHHALALHVDEVVRRSLEAQMAIDVGHQKVQRIVDPRQVLAGEAALHVGVGAHSHEYGIVILEQAIDTDIPADLGIQPELDPHPGEHLAAAGHDGFLQLEFGYAEGQQTADFRIAVEYHGGDPGTHQHIRTSQSGRSRADDRHSLAGGYDPGHVRTPAHG